LTLLEYQIGKLGYDIITAQSGEEALEAVSQERPDLVLLDVMLPGIDGIEVLRRLKQQDETLPVIMMTAAYIGGRGVEDGMTSINKAVEALTLGAHDYILKPSNEFIEKVKLSIQSGLRKRQAAPQVTRLREQLLETSSAFSHIIGESEAMMRVFKMTEKVLDSDATVLLTGESGTGKELIARAIHYNGHRAQGPLVIVNCAAIAETLLDSELFGHEKGAFTGATSRKIGKFEQAQGGTIFLDEIGDMSPDTQAKVLRTLQEKEIVRVGGAEPIKVDVRIIAATNKDLEAQMQVGNFREDLYYRLSVYPIHIPPLRERKSDIPLLAAHFAHRYAEEMGKTITGFSDEAMRLLLAYDWPGNVRELENAIHRAVILASGSEIQVEDLPPAVQELYRPRERSSPSRRNSESPPEPPPPGPLEGDEILPLDKLEAWALRRALELCSGNVSEAARKLGIGRTTFYRKAQQYGIELKSD